MVGGVCIRKLNDVVKYLFQLGICDIVVYFDKLFNFFM